MVANREGCCQTADVAQYESFWLATAAAAPVIALAAVVALPDTLGAYQEGFQRTVDEWFDTPAKLQTSMRDAGAPELYVEAMSHIDLATVKAMMTRANIPLRKIAAYIRWIAVCNVMLQALLLASSLAALAYNVDWLSRWLAIVITVAGVVTLALTLSLVANYREKARDFADMFERGTREEFKKMLLRASETTQGAAEERLPSTDDVT